MNDLEPLGLTVSVDAPQEVNHSSFALAGLYDLEHLGLIGGVSVRPLQGLHRGEITLGATGPIERPSARAKKSTFLTVRARDREVRVAIDFRDAADTFPLDGLYDCDVLFKRSYEPTVIASLPGVHRAIIEPAGLSFSVQSPHGGDRLSRWSGYWLAAMRDGVRPDRDVWRRFRRHLREDRQHWSGTRTQPSSDELRAIHDTGEGGGAAPTVFFQTRSFNRTDDEDANEVHEQRAELVRALRAEFGPAFVGGFIADDLVRERYPDCITSVPTDKASYYGAMSRSSVAVYSRGLIGSAAWKLPEYLVHGRCIVGEPLRATLPTPLEDDVDWVTYRSTAECVERCRSLLGDADRRRSLGENARAYYDAWVDPMPAMHRILRRSIELAGPS